MKLDEYGCLMTEHEGYPSNIGDSCAETSRIFHIKWVLADWPDEYKLYQFITDSGIIRHPNAPPDWRETDIPTDQALPLYLATRFANYPRLNTIIKMMIVDAGYRTGDGNLVSPIFFAILKGWKWLLNLTLLGQIFLFKLPFRWSDSKKKFESNKDSSGDYLNFIHAAIYASPFIRWFIGAEKLKQKVRHYYRDEPNVDWLLTDYDKFIERYWK